MQRQRGLSFLGFIAVAALLAAAALIGFKVTPVYIEYFTVKKVLASTAMEGKDAQPAEIRRLLERKLAADYVEAITSGDLEIEKDAGQIVLSVEYTRKVPLVANVSLFFDFAVSTRR